MRNNFIIIVLCCCLSFLSHAQEKEIVGIMTNGVEVEGIHIINQTSRHNAITDQDGRFVIPAKKGDTLFISAIRWTPQLAIITREQYEKGTIKITLQELVNELAEVRLGSTLTGSLNADLKNIKTEEVFNFDDVGIPGFKGEPEEKIVPVFAAIGMVTAMDIEALYKYLTGYYRKLKIQRKWNKQEIAANAIIASYTPEFFEEAYGIPANKLYDFVLFCIETTAMQDDFKRENFAGVIATFEQNAKVYVARLEETDE